MAERMRGRLFGDARPPDGLLHGPLEDRFVEMMAAPLPGFRVTVEPGSGEDPLPPPFPAGVGILPAQRAGELDPTGPPFQVALVLEVDGREMAGEVGCRHQRQEGAPVFVVLPVADDDLLRGEVHVLTRPLKKAHLRRWRARAALRRTAAVRLAPHIARRLASGPF
jgi:hypothetical protein